ncbi:hypothetical protein AARAC_010735 [Aspergillus arachidicola]|uniref:inorganic diphosphatase n=1 Tax=Aspergillus arachidicola TaxID=656916 RepID=A0A2G7G1M5_9EURO|nr:hypothetical protein AARAC_010735 [Aspergillus arachidicola]
MATIGDPQTSHEICKEELHNPIKQDVFKDKPRFMANIEPLQGYPCNYGALPQTWESPDEIDAETGIPGDDDPLDVCEIGSTNACCAEVKRVKPLGAFAVIDEGQTDWKVIAIDINDPIVPKLSDIHDVEAVLPGYLGSLQKWYRAYKVSEGKPQNAIALGGELKTRQ